MNVIHGMAVKLGEGLNKQINWDKNSEQVFVYVFERVLNYLITGLILFPLAYLLDVVIESFLFVIIFVPLRSRFGGWHAKSNHICLIVSISISLLVGYTGKLFTAYLFPTILVVYLFAYFIAMLVGVVDNPVKRLEHEQKILFKCQGLFILTMIAIIHFVIYFNGFVVASNIITLSVFLAFFNLLFGK